MTLTPEDVLPLLKKAVDNLNVGRAEAATDAADTLLEWDDLPDEIWVHALTIRGRASLLGGEFEWAIQDFTHVLEVDPDFVRAQLSRGGAYMQTGALDEARFDLRRVLALAPAGSMEAEAARSLLETLDAARPNESETERVELPFGSVLVPVDWSRDPSLDDPGEAGWWSPDGSRQWIVCSYLPTPPTGAHELHLDLREAVRASFLRIGGVADFIETADPVEGRPATQFSAPAPTGGAIAIQLLEMRSHVAKLQLFSPDPAVDPGLLFAELSGLALGMRLVD